jgi:uncharacterized protein (TIGR03437 family)
MEAREQHEDEEAEHGLDQVNVLLPQGLAGSGEVDVEVIVAGKAANVVRVMLE